ncbi:hypothetical protein [Xylella fastidiosa]|uniref:hypothetical protein n=2 Tax=Xylella fastidiosa TaxID=2371 RepID=UPI001194DC39|nr:hypothetical protein [Xylella fastidiosa]MBS9446456.1 hypothetical protein [Xylella fastidiosa subsp. multiplex]MBS9448471.1 hypothetical protein [Xylella fastidiosa subsp. multiplex]MBS9450485.1 hypothetical protein [Xylella fastidiosa subsp. multiplex]MBS9452464.1 hypothetical protein [Xylella fastidiosa subsp. multiplex]MBS9486805.1 hypothetical protein [Xylella fastidiosa subsp. multiplex]
MIKIFNFIIKNNFCRFFNRKSYVEKVKEFFDHLKRYSPSTSDWIADLEHRAYKKQLGWQADADSYLHGLVAAGALSTDAAASCRKHLTPCISESTRNLIFWPIAWVVIIATMTVARLALVANKPFLIVLVLLTAVASGVWASRRPSLNRYSNSQKRRLDKRVFVAVCAIFIPLVIYEITEAVGLMVQQVSIKQFNADRSAFMTDPQGFPMLHKLAREQYGVEVVLGDAEDSWAYTTLRLPNASAASMGTRSGYCVLNFNKSNVLGGFKSAGQVDPVMWVQGVMMHEFAHCLDGSRDMPTFGQKAVGVRSVAPSDTPNVKDIQSLVEASTRPTTQLWRESVADIMAVGFWKLAAPNAAHELAAELRQKRADAKHDTTHATMCWIDFANQATPPSSTGELFEWADKLRNQAPCQPS